MHQLFTRIRAGYNFGYGKFFRTRLLTATHEQIEKIIERMDQEAADIRRQAIKMSWHMRGGASYEDVLNMSYNERAMIGDLIKDNLETTKNSRLPFF